MGVGEGVKDVWGFLVVRFFFRYGRGRKIIFLGVGILGCCFIYFVFFRENFFCVVFVLLFIYFLFLL